MPAAKLDLLIEQGATWTHTLIINQGSGEAAPPANLTGYTARMQIRAEVESASALIDLTIANGRIVITPAEGKIALTISAADTAALDFDVGVYDLELVSPTGHVDRVVQGKVTLSREVTR